MLTTLLEEKLSPLPTREGDKARVIENDFRPRPLVWLRDAEFIYEQPAFPEPDYVFKHALTQEVVDNSVLVEQRKGLHGRAASAIELLFHNRLDDQYSELASHSSRSSNVQQAIEYLGLAGQQAVQQSAYSEAMSRLTKGLNWLQTVTKTPI